MCDEGAIRRPSGPKTQPHQLMDLTVVRPPAERDDNLPGLRSVSCHTAKRPTPLKKAPPPATGPPLAPEGGRAGADALETLPRDWSHSCWSRSTLLSQLLPSHISILQLLPSPVSILQLLHCL